MKRSLFSFMAVFVTAMLLLTGCGDSGSNSSSGGSQNTSRGVTLTILSGSENKGAVEQIVQEGARSLGINVQFDYKGSVDIMLELEKGKGSQYDAVWPADRIWLRLGDKQHAVKGDESIFRSPVIVGVKQSVARRLGWVNGKVVTVKDFQQAVESGQLRYMQTSASQSNSGAVSYIGMLYAFAGSPDILTEGHLNDPKIGAQVKKVLGGVNRSSGSSGFLKDLFLQRYDVFDAMVNYEAIIAETNMELQRTGREPLVAVYLSDGLALADSPLGLIDKGDAAKNDAFHKLQQYLLSPQVQAKFSAIGRRTGLAMTADANALNPSLGFQTTLNVTPINMPEAEVIRKALVLYQTAFRKPSLTVYCLDFSGSMASNGGEGQLKDAMRILLEQSNAERYMIQASPGDVTIVIPFSGASNNWPAKTVKGNNATELLGLWQWISSLNTDGGTAINQCAIRALNTIKQYNYENYSTAVVLMTDGENTEGNSFQDLEREIAAKSMGSVPIYSVMFGSASKSHLESIARLTGGKVFDGSKDLVHAMREAKGYNN